MGSVLDAVQRGFPHLLHAWGYLAVFVAVAADSFGIPIPGEVMLLLAAVYAGATHHLLLPLVVGAAAFAAMAGDNTTYTLARMGGYPILSRYGRFLHLGRRRLKIGQYLFQRYGTGIVWAGRLVPVLHIWTAVLAGVNRMPWLRFFLANAAGAVAWASALSLIGYMVGRVAIRIGGLVAGVALPAAILIAVAVILLLRANEHRLYRSAQQHAEIEEQGAA
jgi:membrane protein DedA with SNARE-associated domain